MHLGIVGYLVSLANLQAFGGPNSQMKDLSVQVADVVSLANQLKGDPQFPIDNFRKNGYYRNGDVGKYVSISLRKYLFENESSGEEGTVITIFFKGSSDPADKSGEDNFSHVLWRKYGLDENEIQDVIDKYLDEFDKRHGGGK